MDGFQCNDLDFNDGVQNKDATSNAGGVTRPGVEGLQFNKPGGTLLDGAHGSDL